MTEEIKKPDDDKVNLSDEDKKDLIEEFNKRGYLLEDRMIEVLDSIENHYGILKGEIGMEYGRRNNNERVEIDAMLFTNQKLFLFDAKRTEYDWIFAPSLHKAVNTINLICHHPKRKFISLPMKVRENSPIRIVHHDFVVGFEGANLGKKNDKKSLALPKEKFRPIHDGVRQILKETKAVLLEGRKYLKNDAMFLIPVIVTNARLLYIDYKKEQIDSKGNLTDFNSMSEIPAVGYNFHESLGFNTEQGLSSSKPENIVKTIVIININHLKEMIEYFSKQYLWIDFKTDEKFFTIPDESDYHETKKFWDSD